ncbi:MAG: A/G-specific adenine glycosylase [Alphaproteobacteria bacterium]|nr:MAG: A/G-specific adenine glycosylase [Alphaproteobacteria bacterium]
MLAWYDAHGRDLPWRAKGGIGADPYRVWLSEIMLQQTTVAAVVPRFRAFLARWPTLPALAAADAREVLAAWAGLGYYARARNMIACARLLVAAHGGCFPDTEDALARLPGIGRYSAAAIAAIAFGRPAVVVDGNVARVMARAFAIAAPLKAAKALVRDHAARLTPMARPGDYAQAVMDLGAMVCTPKAPDCPACPWRRDCAAHQLGRVADLPLTAPRTVRRQRRGVVFWLEAGDAVLLRRRPPVGLLGGMLALPSSDWAEGQDAARAMAAAPVAAPWRLLPGHVRHVFTHFELELAVARAVLAERPLLEGEWTATARVLDAGLPTVFAKAARHALDAI